MNTLFERSGTMTRVIVSLTTAVLLSGGAVLLPQVASAVTVAELQASIAALQAQLNALLAQQGQTPSVAGKCTFTRDLNVGSTGDDVKCLQQYLNSSGNQVAASGAGSPGSESTYFGAKTKAAVAKWQAAQSVSPAAGYFGTKSRAKYNSLVAVAPPPPPPPGPGVQPPPPSTITGTGLSVAAGTQPGDSLSPLNAAHIPVTRILLTASSDGDVQVSSITVERQGPVADSSIKELELLDENGVRIGVPKTLNSNHQAVLNNAFVVSKGQTRTITIGLNRPSSGSDGGSIGKFAVVAVNAGNAAVSGSLPIVGSSITMNSTLTIGTVDLQKGVHDPGVAQTENIGTTGYIFTALRISPSTEDVTVKSISFNQSGSAASSDLQNVKIVFDGTEYAATVSSDGKYYTTTFGGGVDVAKGAQKEVWVKGDVVNGSNRTADFDLYRYSDLYVVGKQYGYNIIPTSSGSSSGSVSAGSFSSDSNPAFNAYTATIGAGTLTVTASTAIPAQNVAINVPDQPLAGFDVEAKGEPISVSSMVIRVSSNQNASNVTAADFTNVYLADNTTGKIVAGPKDGSGSSNGSQMVFTFTDSVTYPVGKRAFVLKGKLSTDFTSNLLVSASTTPSSDWTSVTGQVSGSSITPANTGTVSGNSMTVKSGAVNVSLSNTPTSQKVIRGAKGFIFANIVFDGTNSGEDVRFTSAKVEYSASVGNDLNNCQLWDGTTALNTGSNIVNPASTDGFSQANSHTATAANKTFTLDNNLVVPKGTAKTVALKCDVSKSGTGDQAQWTFSSDETFGATGLTSATTITPSVASSSVANLMTMSSGGTLTVSLDPSSPSVRLAQSGQEVTVSALRFSAANEDITLTQVALQMSATSSAIAGLYDTTQSATASSSAADIVKYTLWDGANKVGEIAATSSRSGIIITTGTCAGCSPLAVTKDTDKIVTVKAQLSDLGNNLPGKPGHLIAIDWQSVNLNGNNATYGVGSQSSSNVYSGGSTTASAGVRMVRAYPTVSTLPLPSTTLSNGSQVLYRFSVSAPAGGNGVSLYKVTFNIASTAPAGSTTPINNLALFAFTGSNFSGGAYTSDGQLNNGSTFFSSDSGNDGINATAVKATTSDYAIYFNPVSNTSATPEAIAIPAGQTYYFELRGTVSGAVTGSSVTTVLEGDRAWYGLGNTSGGVMGFDNAGFCNNCGSINYGFATSAPFIDQAHDNAAGTSVAGGQGNTVSASQTWTNQSGAGANFIWSDNATTTHSGASGAFGPDWFNGVLIPGLPTSGTVPQTLTK